MMEPVPQKFGIWHIKKSKANGDEKNDYVCTNFDKEPEMPGDYRYNL